MPLLFVQRLRLFEIERSCTLNALKLDSSLAMVAEAARAKHSYHAVALPPGSVVKGCRSCWVCHCEMNLPQALVSSKPSRIVAAFGFTDCLFCLWSAWLSALCR